jgi:hypothetical protein
MKYFEILFLADGSAELERLPTIKISVDTMLNDMVLEQMRKKWGPLELYPDKPDVECHYAQARGGSYDIFRCTKKSTPGWVVTSYYMFHEFVGTVFVLPTDGAEYYKTQLHELRRRFNMSLAKIKMYESRSKPKPKTTVREFTVERPCPRDAFLDELKAAISRRVGANF